MTLVRTLAEQGTNSTRMLVMADPVFEVSDARFQAKEQSRAGDQDRHAEQSGREARGTVLLGVKGLRRLPESEKLAQSMKELLGPDCQSYTGLACTKQRFLQTFNSSTAPYSAVVFGTHGFAANDLPGVMEPALAMTMVPRGTDGLLTMTEVAGLSMDVDTAALTACKTGLGMRLAGEGVLSMGRAFQAAGTKSVIMSLWSVAEEPSIALVDEFFRQRAQGRSKLDAWAGARAHVRGLGFEHPFFWASFILVGETQ
jgi:CHAT domain-containing protein